jgi:iron complex outermembrane receptor protein
MKSLKTKVINLSIITVVSTFTFSRGAEPAPKTQEASRLPEVIVETDPYRQIQKELWKTPGGVVLLTAPEIEKTRAANLKDVFQWTPGVYAQPRQGSADESTLSIRGSGLRNQFHLRGIRLYLDGMLLSNADGFSDFDAVELLALDHIEVYKGANGLQIGANALGGGINFVSKKGDSSDLFQTRTEAGSFGFVKGQLSSGQILGKGWDYYVSMTAQREDGYRRHQDLERERFFGNFGWKISQDTDARFYLIAVNSRNELAGSLTKSQLQLAPRSSASGFAQFDALNGNQRRDTEVIRTAMAFKHRIDSDQRVEMNVYYQWKDLDHPLGFAWIDNELNDTGLEIRYVNTAEIAENENEFVLGVTPQYGRILDAQYTHNLGNRGALRQNQVDETYNMGAWVQDTYSFLPDWKAVAGTRFDWSSRNLTDRFLTNGDQSSEVNYTGFSPRVGLIHDYSPTIQMYGNLSMAYEPPVFGELVLSGNSGLVNLEAQKSYQMEVGTRGKWNRFDWDLSFYNAEIEDELFQNTLGNTGASVLSSIPRTRHTGVELGLGVKVWDGIFEISSEEAKRDYVKFSTMYTWSDFRIVSDSAFTDKRLPGMPEHYWINELSYHHPSGFFYSFTVETAPQAYFVDKANNLQNDGYTVFAMKSGMEFSNRLKLFAELRNLTDVTYASAVTTTEAATSTSAQFRPADGFAMYGGMEWSY